MNPDLNTRVKNIARQQIKYCNDEMTHVELITTMADRFQTAINLYGKEAVEEAWRLRHMATRTVSYNVRSNLLIFTENDLQVASLCTESPYVYKEITLGWLARQNTNDDLLVAIRKAMGLPN